MDGDDNRAAKSMPYTLRGTNQVRSLAMKSPYSARRRLKYQ